MTHQRRRFRVGIRLKVLLVSSILITIPWLGYEYVREVERFLRHGQEQTLVGTARAIATALHDRPALFNQQASFLSSVKEDRDLYARVLSAPIQLDGDIRDWSNYRDKAHSYGADHVLESAGVYDPASLSFEHMVGKYGQFLYAVFQVTDDRVVYRSPRTLRLDWSDHLQIALADPEGRFRRYLLTATQPGWVNAYLMPDDPGNPRPLQPEIHIKGEWRATAGGYTLEIRIPLTLIGAKLGFAIADIDDPRTRAVKTVIGTSGTKTVAELGTVLVPSPEIEQIIRGMGRAPSRIWVVDRSRRVLAHTGSLKNQARAEPDAPPPAPQLWRRIEDKVLHPLYALILRQPSEDFEDELSGAERLAGGEIDAALNGDLKTQWRLTPDRRAVVLSAAHPIWIGDQVMGAVVVEETTNAILTVRNRALEQLLNVTLAAFLLGAVTLFLFASRISSRIRRLRNEAETAIDPHGRVRGAVTSSAAGDEIGDLSRSFFNILERLRQYTGYLETMADRLSHEIRTPIAVVRSSLDNLGMQALPPDAQVYMGRAREGLDRLSAIIASMSEATRLEQTLQRAEREAFDLNQVLAGCVAGYQGAYPGHRLVLREAGSPVPMLGAPDLIAQMLDKLVANATDFSKEGAPIIIRLTNDGRTASLRVINEGTPLPEAMQGRLFDSMVSVRPHKSGAHPHLGLGLYIVRLIAEFHGGAVAASNREDVEGVVVTASFPIQAKKGD